MITNAKQETYGFQTEVKQLLQIVVHSLYSNREIFLRELISNASDAADRLRFEALSDPGLYESDSSLGIHVAFDAQARTITVSDNGIGMSRDEMIENLGTIAKSGTHNFLSQLSGDQKKDAHLIGQFGVGFYSSFMVADKVTVISRRAGSAMNHGVIWESDGNGEYTIASAEKEKRGTEIILYLKEGDSEFLDEWRLSSIIRKYSDHLNIPIFMKKRSGEGEEATEWEETVNRATALWTLAKNEVTEGQYTEFYKHLTHDPEGPLTWAHHRVEGGNTEYTALLYVPGHSPFNLWQSEPQYGMKLYVQRVFVMDEMKQFLPYYLRFVRGVMDTAALPLNISREILQDHPAISKLRSALTKHVLDLLERLASDEPGKYATFWNEFGNVLKEGVAEDFTNRGRVSKLLRFASTHSEGQTASLDDYVKRMKPAQKKIYYVTAENISVAKSSPHLEIFRKNDIEVMLLTDRIDEWIVGHLPEHEGKALQSVSKGDFEPDEITAGNEGTEKQEKEDSVPEQKKDFDGFLKQVRAILDTKISDVRLSGRLTTSPACIVRSQDAPSLQMERMLKAAGQPVIEAKPILEINPEHMLVKRLRDETDEKELDAWANILHDQALLAEGGSLSDPAAFVQRLNNLWVEWFLP